MKRTTLLTLGLSILAAAAVPAFAQTPTACETCHADGDLFEQAGLQMIEDFHAGAHAAAGLSCHDCHGGNPDPAVADDMMAAMDENFSDNPYVGTPERGAIPGFCGRCHSDPSYMKRFKPDARVDQEREYWTSRHGEALQEGDINVATCIDCHGTHGILQADSPDSMVFPTQVAETCRGCHGDTDRMSGYTLPNGQPLPIDQYARWRQSVHAENLLVKEDLTAPTCNDCHGNHGAAPPGLDSVAFVCGQCHGREAEMFRQSPKMAATRSRRPRWRCPPSENAPHATATTGSCARRWACSRRRRRVPANTATEPTSRWQESSRNRRQFARAMPRPGID